MSYSIDDSQKDYETIIENMMKGLCERQRKRGIDGTPVPFPIDDVWHKLLDAFTSRDYLIQFLNEFQRRRGYIEIINGTHIRLTQQGRNYCKDLGD